MIVEAELEVHNIPYNSIQLGEVNLQYDLTDKQHLLLSNGLLKFGLELMDDKRSILISKIKAVIIEMIHYEEELPRVNNSEYIANKLQYDYKYLSALFSEVQGITIEQYIINNKIEKVKELLVYNEMNLTEIASKLHYSSVAHLSAQFKKITGLTPSHFKQMKDKRRISIENL